MLLYHNLTRNKRRTILTIAGIALPLFVFLTTAALRDMTEKMFERLEKSMKVATHQKLSFTTYLPQRVRGEIESIAPEGYLEGVCRASWFGGRIPDNPTTFPNMAVDADTFPVVYAEYEMTDEEIARFQSERRAAVMSPATAKSLDIGIGDRITLRGTLPPFLELEFVVVALPEELDGWMYFRFDYLDEAYREQTGGPIGVHNFWMRCSSRQAQQWALTEIDKHFANSQNQTRTETEAAFVRAFVESGGDWVGMAWGVGQLVVFVALSVGFNTMSMSFRERTRELAVLRALGFSATRVVGMLLLEGLLLGLIGGLVAALPIFAASQAGLLELPQMGTVDISPVTVGIAVGVAVLCGLLAAVIPAMMAGRLEVATALRKVA